MKKKLLIVFLSLLLVSGFNGYLKASENFPVEKYFYLTNQISGENAYNSVKTLTCDEFEGRLSGSKGFYRSAYWIVDKMREIGLKPGLKKENGYLQEFGINKSLFRSNDIPNSSNDGIIISVNVIGYLQAINENSDDTVLIVAHFDHLGKHPMYNTIYRGANDNASGVSCLLEIARVLSNNNFFPSVNFVFIAFSGEEEGLIGSKFYVKNPVFPLNNIKAVINLDMVGSGAGDLTYGIGSTSSSLLDEYLSTCAKALNIRIRFDSDLTKPNSDHYPFAQSGIPYIFFLKDDPTHIGHYHTTRDTIETIDPKNLEDASKLSLLITSSFSQSSLFIFDDDLYKEKVFDHPRILLKGEGVYFRENFISMYLNKSRLFTDLSNNFEYLYKINTGENIANIDFGYNKLLSNKKIIIKADIDDNLKCDFDYDYDVDLDDMISLSKRYGKRVKITGPESIFDLDNNHIIDQKDIDIFSHYLGYTSNKKQLPAIRN
jgi:aminopeptidase YwaD